VVPEMVLDAYRQQEEEDAKKHKAAKVFPN